MYNKNLNDLIREFVNEDVFGGSLTEFRFPKVSYNNVNRREYSENTPSTNVYEDEWSYRYELSTPGFTKKDLTITLNDTTLEIKGERKIENKKEKGEYISREYHTTKFLRSFNLPENIVLDEVHAKVENGITILYLPKVTKTKLKKGTRTIEIS
jgi:HSP20 family protein